MNKKLVAKIDVVFSKMIRARDNQGGYFRCCSCSQLKGIEQADAGHFINRRWIPTRWREDNVHAQCRSCLTPDTRVLMADFTWKALGGVKIGDKLIGFDENAKYKTSRRYKVTTVVDIEKAMAQVYEVELGNGDKLKTTGDHRWLARYGTTSGYRWIETQRLWVNSKNMLGHHISGHRKEHAYSTVAKPFKVVEQEPSYEAGWIAGMIDADGHITQQIARDKRTPNKLGKLRSKYDTSVVAIRLLGEQEIVVMGTDCHTFIAEGYAMHNCNRFDEGNAAGYAGFMIQRYGKSRVDYLLGLSREHAGFTDSDGELMLQEFKRKLKKL